MGKETACNAGDTGDMGSIFGSGRSPEGGNGNPLQYSCLGNPKDRGAWQTTVQKVTKSQMWLSTYTRTCTRTLAHSPQGSAPPSAGGALPHSHLLLLPPQPHDHCRTRPLLQNHPLLETLPGPPTPQLCLPPAGRGLTENRMGQERVFCGPVNGLPSPQTALYFSLPFCLWQVGLVLLFTINLLFWLLRRKR